MLLRPTGRPSCRPTSLSWCRLSRGTSSLSRIWARLRMPNHFLPCSRLWRGRSTWLYVLLPALTHFNPQALPCGQLHPFPLREWICPRSCNLRVPTNSLHPIHLRERICPRPCNLRVPTNSLHSIPLPWRNSPQPLNVPMQWLITEHPLFSIFGTGGFLSWEYEIRLLLACQGLLGYSLKNKEGFYIVLSMEQGYHDHYTLISRFLF